MDRAWLHREIERHDDDDRFLWDEGYEAEAETLCERIKAEPSLVNERDDLGDTPLHRAVRELATLLREESEAGHKLVYRIAETLLHAGADPNARGMSGDTPLFYAASDDIIALLIEHGGAVNAQNERGSTPLMHAIQNPALAGTLLGYGADPDLQNYVGQNARTWADLAGQEHVIDLFGQPRKR